MNEIRGHGGLAPQREQSGQGPLIVGTHTAEIIVCVHNALPDVHFCLASLAANTDRHHRLILVDDSSEPACRDELERYAGSNPTAVLLRNASRLGYTRSANRGLGYSRAGFVVLLNSDTIVTPGWLDRLLECAESDARIGIVGPLSNSAAFQSVPERYDRDQGWLPNPLPAGWQPNDVANTIAAIAPRTFPRVGVLNGFCFAIKRAVIDAIGYFDEVSFPDGYGEEHDYCFRAAEAGFHLAVADHAYVYHAGTRSYQPEQRQVLKLAARAALARKHKAKRIREAVFRTYAEPTLERIRTAVAEALRGTSPYPDAPLAAPDGISQEIPPTRETNLWVMALPTEGMRSSLGTFQERQETRATMQHDAGSTSRQNPLLWSFMGELDTQCANAEMAYTALVMALSERGPDGSRGRAQQRKIFFYAHAFMTHAAMISRILWPSREVHERDIEEFGLEHGDALKTIRKERGKQVRKALRCEISPLKDFAAGDYLERNDARLEVWTLSSASANARDMMVSPLDIGNGSDPPNVIRHFDPITMTYTFLSEQFDLPAIAALLSRIHRAVARWVTAQGHD